MVGKGGGVPSDEVSPETLPSTEDPGSPEVGRLVGRSPLGTPTSPGIGPYKRLTQCLRGRGPILWDKVSECQKFRTEGQVVRPYRGTPLQWRHLQTPDRPWSDSQSLG